MLVAILLLPSPWAAVLTGVQAVLFAIGATRGVQHTPHAWLFRALVRPRLSAPGELEDPAPPRFAQAVGLGFAVVGLVALALGATLVAQVAVGLGFTVLALVGYLSGVTLLGQVAIGFALVAALLNAVFRFCLGCELYLLTRRIRPIGG